MKKLKWNKFFTILLIAIMVISCKNYYNETIEWTDNLGSDLSIKEVQKIQPDFIKVDWINPQIVDDQKWYMITEIKGNNDVLGMTHYLVFIDEKYQYRESKK